MFPRRFAWYRMFKCCPAVLLFVRESVWTQPSRMGLCEETGCGPVSYSLDSMPPSWTGTHMYGYIHHIDVQSYMIQLSYTMTTELETTRKEENVRWAAGHSKVLYIRCRSLIQGLFLPNLFATLVIKYEKLKCTHP